MRKRSEALERSDWATLQAEIVRCRRCPRLVAWREGVAQQKVARFCDQLYWGRPVPGFGDVQARLWVIGLAPASQAPPPLWPQLRCSLGRGSLFADVLPPQPAQHGHPAADGANVGRCL